MISAALLQTRKRRLVTVAGLLTVFDAAATWGWLQLGVQEGNPIVRSVVEMYGPTLGMTLRAVWGLALIVLLARIARRSWLARSALVGIAVGMGLVAMVHVAGGTATILALI